MPAISADKDKLVRELGAHEIVRDGKGLAAVGGADVILGTSNSVDAMAESIAGLRPDGRLVLMGLENKPLAVHGRIDQAPYPHPWQPATL
jgi:D-arabinose 1-dehydrogenase-like Zn-dependent alcohol dehydrogenase